MRSTRLPVLTLAFSLTASFNITAETLSEIYEQALQNDPQLRADRAAFMAGQESKNIGRAALLPNISAVGEFTDSEYDDSSSRVFGPQTFRQQGDVDSETENYSLSLQQPLFDLSAWFAFQQGVQLSQQAAAEFSAAQQAMIFSVALSGPSGESCAPRKTCKPR